MQNIMKIIRDLNNFFDGNFELNHMIDVVLNKLELHMQMKYHVPDWKGDYTWANSFVQGIKRKPLKELSLDWIWEQIRNEAIREIKDDSCTIVPTLNQS